MIKRLLPSLAAVTAAALLQTQLDGKPPLTTTSPSSAYRHHAASARSGETQSFFFRTDSDIYSGVFEVTMRCPAHAFRSPEWALEKLKRIRADNPAQEIRVWVCRANQMPTLRMFAPVSDVIGINPFVRPSNKPPGPDALIWPHFDHPVINSIREIRLVAPRTRLFVSISVEGQAPLFRERSPSFEELRWMAYAVIGGNYQGISWRPDRGQPPGRDEIARLEKTIKAFAPDLAKARPVNCVAAPAEQPVSALVGGKRLFVVLLSPEYMVCRDRKPVQYPVAPTVRTGEIKILTGQRFRVLSGTTISGLSLDVQNAPDAVRVSYRLANSGEILVLQLDREPPGPATRPSPVGKEGTKR